MFIKLLTSFMSGVIVITTNFEMSPNKPYTLLICKKNIDIGSLYPCCIKSFFAYLYVYIVVLKQTGILK